MGNERKTDQWKTNYEMLLGDNEGAQKLVC